MQVKVLLHLGPTLLSYSDGHLVADSPAVPLKGVLPSLVSSPSTDEAAFPPLPRLTRALNYLIANDFNISLLLHATVNHMLFPLE